MLKKIALLTALLSLTACSQLLAKTKGGAAAAGNKVAEGMVAAPPSFTCAGIQPVKVAVGERNQYDAKIGIKTEKQFGFAVRLKDPKPDHGCHYVIRSGECIVMQYKKSDTGDVTASPWEHQFIVQELNKTPAEVGGASIVFKNGLNAGAIMGRCPHDSGFGCINKDYSERAGHYFKELDKAGLVHRSICAVSPSNKFHKAMGKTVFGGIRNANEDKFLFTVSWRVAPRAR